MKFIKDIKRKRLKESQRESRNAMLSKISKITGGAVIGVGAAKVAHDLVKKHKREEFEEYMEGIEEDNHKGEE